KALCTFMFVLAAFSLLLTPLCLAQSGTRTIASELDAGLSYAESEQVAAAETMPDGKYSFAPSGGEFKDVRSFADQLKHIAAYNKMLCSAIEGKTPPSDTAGGNGPANLKSKGEVLQYLKDAFSYCHQAFKVINEKNAAEEIKPEFRGATSRLYLAHAASAHSFDHYGQVVVYLRMNGLVPAATVRRQQQQPSAR
ncbi:MAG: DinB family protein, partial [Candidatus Korobacteraceae bacterium]